MNKKPVTNRPTSRTRSGEPTGSGKATLDTWLDTKLRNAYSSVLDEPIPDDLIQLLHQKLKD